MTESDEIEKRAIISECGTYRYALSRFWDIRKRSFLIFIMLNPSTADDKKDDPTIRRCINFTIRENRAGMAVLNLFALRATDPKELKKHHAPVGPENNEYINSAIREMREPVGKFVAAWGAHGTYKNRDYKVRQIFKEAGQDLYCLGKTSKGHPKHPLYVPADTPLEIYMKANPHG